MDDAMPDHRRAAARPSADAVAPEVRALCRAAVAALTGSGHDLASVYLISGDRLRCMAVSGYGQLFDGIAPGTGVIGRAFVQQRVLRARTDASAEYRAAADGVADEIAVPLLDDGACQGVLNVEARQAFTDDDVATIEQAALRLSAAIARAGGPPQESRSQRLVRHSTVMASAETPTGLADALLRAAADLTGYGSAALLGQGRVHTSAGLHGPQLRALPGPLVDNLLAWVEHGGSSRTSSDRSAAPGTAQAALAEAGLRSFVLVPLESRGEMLGGLVVGDDREDEAGPQTVETLELLAALAAADLRTLRATDVLRRQARTDHLTGLPHRRAFEQALDDALGGPEADTAAVLLIDLDGFKAINDQHGHQAGDEALSKASRALGSALRAEDALYRIGGDEFATLLPAPSRAQLAEIADRLLQAARGAGVTVSIGAATAGEAGGPVRGEALVRAADERLYEAKRQGRDRACLPLLSSA